MLLDAASVDLKHPSSTGSSVTVLRYLSTALLMESIGVDSGMFLMCAGRALKRKAAFPLNEFIVPETHFSKTETCKYLGIS